jgi:deoxyribodipyrimidine photo-lyase
VAELRDPERVPDPHDPDPDTRELVGYPAPMVDHAAERQEALDRWQAIRD